MVNSEKKLLSAYVTELRKKEELSIRAFADKYSVSKSFIERLENGLYDDPTLLIARKFCDAFSISHEDFINDFQYSNTSIFASLNSKDTIDYLSVSPKDELLDKVYLNFYKCFSNEYGFHDFARLNSESPENNTSINFIHGAKCLDKNNNVVYMNAFGRNYYMDYNNPPHYHSLSCIERIHSYSAEALGSNYFVVLVYGKSIYDYIKNLHFSPCDKHVLLVLYSGEDNFVETTNLF